MQIYLNIGFGLFVIQFSIILGTKPYGRRVWFFQVSVQTKSGLPGNKQWSLTRGRNY